MTYTYFDNYATQTFKLKVKCGNSTKWKAESDRDTVVVDYEGPEGCPKKNDDPGSEKKKKKLSFGSIMLIIISVALVLYFAAGMPLMFFAFKKRGIEIIPFVYFWSSIPRMVILGIKTILSPCLSKSRGFKEMQ
eukprot:MONOS_15293.1-p1 / transcript=MONOS_15293.1 / gene=MONOS_15293 / organism=Monocercomonoides_exilis_PA203 / gene_product=unspecified product / transcript_product=unspecified product / location=Mono_scaffold01191:13514-14134(+) / protein_length=133 / sequence_SO=supercontig / SO=protein_coding / is_pseudo=false